MPASTLSCIIIEDQAPAKRVLEKYIKDCGVLTLKGSFTDGIDALEFLKQHNVSLIFLDIHLPKLSGIDFLKILSNPPQVILTTAFSDYAIESYELDVVDYLLKPFSFERFLKAVNKVQKPVELLPEATPEERLIFIKSGYEHIKVELDHLLYIKADMDYTEFVSTSKTHLSNETLAYWEEQLSASNFVRIHRSYLVNIKSITKFSSAQVQLSNGKTLNVGRVYRENLKHKFKLL